MSAFNKEQLASWGEATRIADRLNKSQAFRQAGITVKPQNPPNSGIYRPVWLSGPGGFPEPHGDGTYSLHFRFSNGMEGMNVGLVREKFDKYPTSPLYVIGTLLTEVQQGAH